MGNVLVMCGIPGSGKSTFAAKIAAQENCVIISSDMIRKNLYGDANIQGDVKEVFEHYHNIALQEHKAGKDIILDATNLKEKNRRKVFEMFENLAADIYAIVICGSLEKCLERNACRERQVPHDVIKRMHNSFEYPHLDEGFKNVIVFGENIPLEVEQLQKFKIF